jgi:hypothetical protein
MDYRAVLLAATVLGTGVLSLVTSCAAPDPGEVTFMERQKSGSDIGGSTSSSTSSTSSSTSSSGSDGGGSTTSGGPVTAFSGAPAYVATDPAAGGNKTTVGHQNGDPKFLSCQDCHKNGGQASGFPWAIGGTVYDANTGGAAVVQAEVRVVDSTGKEIAKAYTDTQGNFWFDANNVPGGIPAGSKVGVRNGTKTKLMSTDLTGVGDGACQKAGCHATGGQGHIFLN